MIDIRKGDLASLVRERNAAQFLVCQLNSAVLGMLRSDLKSATVKTFPNWVVGFEEIFPKYYKEFFDKAGNAGLTFPQKQEFLSDFLHQKNIKNRKILNLVRQMAN